MSHCPACKGYTGIQHGEPNRYGVYAVERIACPGCGHEDLERQLAEAQTRVECALEPRMKADAERDALQATLEQAQTVIEAARKINPWCMLTHGHVPTGWREFRVALATLDAEKEVGG